MYVSLLCTTVYRHESALLRQELSQRHDQDTRAVLSELANLKDNALKQANHLWEDERTKLLVKVDLKITRGINLKYAVCIYPRCT